MPNIFHRFCFRKKGEFILLIYFPTWNTRSVNNLFYFLHIKFLNRNNKFFLTLEKRGKIIKVLVWLHSIDLANEVDVTKEANVYQHESFTSGRKISKSCSKKLLFLTRTFISLYSFEHFLFSWWLSNKKYNSM